MAVNLLDDDCVRIYVADENNDRVQRYADGDLALDLPLPDGSLNVPARYR